MNIIEATKAYEHWADARVKLVAADVRHKHRLMAEAAFPFLRGTFYRWCQLWREVCPELAAAPKVLAIGDVHVENFGTWRDAEGRLVWGINDFDEAFPMPYANDLVRLATSALLAIEERKLKLSAVEACGQILDGYCKAVEEGGAPFVLEEAHPLLRAMALSVERDPASFWGKLSGLARVRAPAPVKTLLLRQMPKPHTELKIAHRVAGVGSLGRPRYLAIALCAGGWVAREAKALLPSAYGWAMQSRSEKLFCERIESCAIRVRDPFLVFDARWIVNRAGPHCSRIGLTDLPQSRDERHLLHAMGSEIANVHLGTPDAAAAIERDLKRRAPGWLNDAAKRMADATLEDWTVWRKSVAPDGASA